MIKILILIVMVVKLLPINLSLPVGIATQTIDCSSSIERVKMLRMA